MIRTTSIQEIYFFDSIFHFDSIENKIKTHVYNLILDKQTKKKMN